MPLRLAMLGMWHTHADGIVRQVADNPNEFTLVGFTTVKPRVVQRRQKQWEARARQNPRLFDKPKALLREPMDGVVVEGRVHDNIRLARLALEQNKPVLLEKPAGDNLDRLRRLIEQAQRSTCTCR